MLPRFAPLARTALRNTRQNVRNYDTTWRHPKEVAVTTRTTLNDIPVPQGSWQESFQKRNSGWNVWFAAGLITMALSIAATFQVGVFELHSSPDFKKLKPNVE